MSMNEINKTLAHIL